MSTAPVNESIHYLEFHAKDFAKTKSFFIAVFDWRFVDYGSEYMAFSGSGMEGGFFKSPLTSNADLGSALVIFYSNNLEATCAKVEQAGGHINKAIFQFPGGRRSHFQDPNGNEFAVWSEQDAT